MKALLARLFGRRGQGPHATTRSGSQHLWKGDVMEVSPELSLDLNYGADSRRYILEPGVWVIIDKERYSRFLMQEAKLKRLEYGKSTLIWLSETGEMVEVEVTPSDLQEVDS